MLRKVRRWVRSVHRNYRQQAVFVDLVIAAIAFVAVAPFLSSESKSILEAFLIGVVIHLFGGLLANKEMTEGIATRFDAFVGQVKTTISDFTTRELEVTASLGKCGLVSIYADRSEALPAIASAIGVARSRVWLMGVSLHQILDEERLAKLGGYVLRSLPLDVRILLLDPTRSAAVFRSAIETPTPIMRGVATFSPSPARHEHPFLGLTLFANFKKTFASISKCGSALQERVRYYQSGPYAWLIIIDNEAFFQPYTNSRFPDLPDGSRLPADPMPILRFQLVAGAANHAFLALQEHYNVVWATSLADFTMMSDRHECAQTLIQNLMSDKSHAVLQMSHALSKHPGGRRAPRQEMKCNGELPVRVSWNLGDGTTAAATAHVHDIGRNSVGLVFPKADAPLVGANVRMDIPDTISATDASHRLAFTHLHRMVVQGGVLVVRSNIGGSRAGIEATAAVSP